MARSDSLRTEIARLQARKAMLATGIAASEKAAATAREAARNKRDQASRTKSAATARTALSAAEREDKRVVTAEGKIAKARKDIGTIDKATATSTARLGRNGCGIEQGGIDNEGGRHQRTLPRAATGYTASTTPFRAA